MKQVLKTAVRAVARGLPWGAQKALLMGLADALGPMEIINDLAPTTGITDFVVKGQYGQVIGSSHDRVVLGSYAQRGVWAKLATEETRRFFASAGGTFLDIGANIGLTLLPQAAVSNVRCIGIEPEPTNFRYLVQNVQMNCAPLQVELHNVALFEHRGMLQFELAEDNLGDHRIRLHRDVAGKFGEAKRKVISVPGVPLDELVGPVEDRLAVKIDTQGAEPFVIAGGLRTLSRAQHLVIEFSPYHIRRLGGDPEVVFAFLANHFETGRLAQGEGRFGRESSSQAIVNELRMAWLATANTPDDDRYFDVCLWK